MFLGHAPETGLLLEAAEEILALIYESWDN